MAILLMSHVFKYYGSSKLIVSNRDPKITSNFWKGLFKKLGNKLNFSLAYHPQKSGHNEIANLNIIDLVKAYLMDVDQRYQWNRYLLMVEYAYNNNIHIFKKKII